MCGGFERPARRNGNDERHEVATASSASPAPVPVGSYPCFIEICVSRRKDVYYAYPFPPSPPTFGPRLHTVYTKRNYSNDGVAKYLRMRSIISGRVNQVNGETQFSRLGGYHSAFGAQIRQQRIVECARRFEVGDMADVVELDQGGVRDGRSHGRAKPWVVAQ